MKGRLYLSINYNELLIKVKLKFFSLKKSLKCYKNINNEVKYLSF